MVDLSLPPSLPPSLSNSIYKVYDVSSFVSKHPGGVDQIMMGASRDITQVFESYHKHDTLKK